MAPPGYFLKRRQTGVISADRTTAVALRTVISTYRSNLLEKTNNPEEYCQQFDTATSKNLRTALKAFNSHRSVINTDIVESLTRLFDLLSKLYQRNVDAATPQAIQSQQQEQHTPFNGLYGSVKCTLNVSSSKYGSVLHVAQHLEYLGRAFPAPDDSELTSIPIVELFDTLANLCYEIVAFCTRMVSTIYEKEGSEAVSGLEWRIGMGLLYHRLQDLKKQYLVKMFKYGCKAELKIYLSFTYDVIIAEESAAVLSWLLPTEPSDTYRAILNRRQGEGTGGWFLEHPKFKDWLLKADKTLWCPGIPGAGKTMIATIVMEHLISLHEDSTESVGLACVYLSFKEEQALENHLLSIIKQLTQCRKAISGEVVNAYECCRHGKSRPDERKVIEMLQCEVDRFRNTFIVVDALDECSHGVRVALLDKLEKFQPKVRLLVTSRYIDTVADRLKSSVKLEISAQPQDVKAFIGASIEKPDNYRLKDFTTSDPKLRRKIEDTVIDVAKGMFLLAQFHIESLAKGLNPFEVTQALKSLPKSVDDIYTRALERIDEQHIEGHRKFARKVICWVAYSFRPLTVDELLCALAVDPGDREFEHSKVSMQKDITSLCAGLVIIDRDSNVVRLVHSTMQTYFNTREDSPFNEMMEKMADICLTCISFAVNYRQKNFDSEAGLCSDDDSDDSSDDDGIFGKPIVKVPPTMSGYDSDDSSQSSEPRSTLQQASLTAKAPTLRDNSPRQLARSITPPGEVSGIDDDSTGADSPSLDSLYNYDSQYTPYSHLGYLKDAFTYYAVRYWGDHARYHSKQSENSSTTLRTTAILCDKAQRDYLVRRMYSAGMLETIKNVTGLHIAAKFNLMGLSKALLEKHCEVNAQDGNGATALSIAISCGHEEVVYLLLDAGASLDLMESSGQNALILAAEKDCENLVSSILSKTSVDSPTWRENPQVVLLEAAYHGRDAKVTEILESSNLDLEGKDKAVVVTALMLAAEQGKHEVVSTLLKYGIDVNAVGGSGTPVSALHRAAGRGYVKLVKLLLKNKADMNLKDRRGRAAWTWSVEKRQFKVSEYLSMAGANPNERFYQGRSKLYEYASEGDFEATKFILEIGTDPSIQTDFGWAPLHWASAAGYYDVVKLLLEYDADPSPLSDTGETPLDRARGGNHPKVIGLLEKAGAKPGKNLKGRLYALEDETDAETVNEDYKNQEID